MVIKTEVLIRKCTSIIYALDPLLHVSIHANKPARTLIEWKIKFARIKALTLGNVDKISKLYRTANILTAREPIIPLHISWLVAAYEKDCRLGNSKQKFHYFWWVPSKKHAIAVKVMPNFKEKWSHKSHCRHCNHKFLAALPIPVYHNSNILTKVSKSSLLHV